MESSLVCIGNSLLDMSTTGTQELLDRYGLKSNDQIMANEKQLQMFEEVLETMDVEYTAGGGSQNTVRMVQWILDKPRVAAYFGCIGRDRFGEMIQARMEEAGAHVSFMISEDMPSGTCVALVMGRERSLVANLAAANCYRKEHLLQPEQWRHVEKASVLYVAGYHLSVAPDAMLELGKHAAKENKIFSTNLSAPYLCEVFHAEQMQLMPYVDYLFGNEVEFLSFSKCRNFQTYDLREIALKTAELEKKNKCRNRVVVITQGDQPSIVAVDGKVKVFPVIPVDEDDIVDTTGAGDCFVGGFLSQLLQGKDLEECMKWANFAANYIIQRSGVSMDGRPNFS